MWAETWGGGGEQGRPPLPCLCLLARHPWQPYEPSSAHCVALTQ